MFRDSGTCVERVQFYFWTQHLLLLLSMRTILNSTAQCDALNRWATNDECMCCQQSNEFIFLMGIGHQMQLIAMNSFNNILASKQFKIEWPVPVILYSNWPLCQCNSIQLFICLLCKHACQLFSDFINFQWTLARSTSTIVRIIYGVVLCHRCLWNICQLNSKYQTNNGQCVRIFVQMGNGCNGNRAKIANLQNIHIFNHKLQFQNLVLVMCEQWLIEHIHVNVFAYKIANLVVYFHLY